MVFDEDTTLENLCKEYHVTFELLQEANSPHDSEKESFYSAMCTEKPSPQDNKPFLAADYSKARPDDTHQAGHYVRLPLLHDITSGSWTQQDSLLGKVFSPHEAVLCCLHAMDAVVSGMFTIVCEHAYERGQFEALKVRVRGIGEYWPDTGVRIQLNKEQKENIVGGNGNSKEGFETPELSGPQSTRFLEAGGSVLSEGLVRAENGETFMGIVVPDNWIFKGFYKPPPNAAAGSSRAHGEVNEQDIARLWFSAFTVFNTARCMWPSDQMISNYRTQCHTLFVDYLACGSFDHTPFYLHGLCCHSWYWLGKFRTLRLLGTDLNETAGKNFKALVRNSTNTGATGRTSIELRASGIMHKALDESQGLGLCGHMHRCRTLYRLEPYWKNPAKVQGLPTSDEIMEQVNKRREVVGDEEFELRRSFFVGRDDWFLAEFRKEREMTWSMPVDEPPQDEGQKRQKTSKAGKNCADTRKKTAHSKGQKGRQEKNAARK